RLLEGAGILYLSVHAEADERLPMNSFIQLSQGESINGHSPNIRVFARQLLKLDFSNTWLAVLNGCDTASGKIARGEGVLNMVRIFALAQVPVTVASLWKNDDRRSSQLIGDFFKQIANGQIPAIAMRNAKRRLILKLKNEIQYALPYFWSAFEVYSNSWIVKPNYLATYHTPYH
ncbi:CHAT domain-containing protein, partial [bacterium]|nr:CHAT domain-containing protein [bacterium]